MGVHPTFLRSLRAFGGFNATFFILKPNLGLLHNPESHAFMRPKFKLTANCLVNVLTQPSGKNWIMLVNAQGTLFKGFLSSIQREDGSGTSFNCGFLICEPGFGSWKEQVYIKTVTLAEIQE